MFLWVRDDPAFRYRIRNEIPWKEKAEQSMKRWNDVYPEIMK